MISEAILDSAVQHLAGDGFVAYPTETVWGLGACSDRPLAVERLMKWKGRGSQQPMSILVSSVQAAHDLGCAIDGPAADLAARYWPGPLTLVVPRVGGTGARSSLSFADGIEGPEGAVGLRCSSHPVAHALALAVDRAGLGPLTSTSMNRSGEPPATNRDSAMQMLHNVSSNPDAAPFCVLEADGAGDDAFGEAPSSVVDCTKSEPRILRAGAIDSKCLESIWRRHAAAHDEELAR